MYYKLPYTWYFSIQCHDIKLAVVYYMLMSMICSSIQVKLWITMHLTFSQYKPLIMLILSGFFCIYLNTCFITLLLFAVLLAHCSTHWVWVHLDTVCVSTGPDVTSLNIWGSSLKIFLAVFEWEQTKCKISKLIQSLKHNVELKE